MEPTQIGNDRPRKLISLSALRELDKAADPCVMASAPSRECDKVREKIHFAIGMREIKLSAAENEEGDIAYPEFRNERKMRDTREEYLVSNDTFAQTKEISHCISFSSVISVAFA